MCTVLLPPGGYPVVVNKYIIIVKVKYSCAECLSLEHPSGAADGLKPPLPNLKNTDFVSTMISKVLSDIRVTLNEPPKSAYG